MQGLKTKSSTFTKEDNDYEKYVTLSVQWNRWILKPIGVWPSTSNVSKSEKWFQRLTNFVCCALMIFLFVPCTLYLLLEVKDLYQKCKLTGPLIFCSASIVKYNSMVFHENDIRECIRRIEWDWKNITHFQDRNIMIATAKFGRRLVTICTAFMYSGFVFYFMVIPVSIGKITSRDDNLTFVPMVFPVSKFIMDIRYSPVNEIFVFIQFIAGFLIHDITVGACSMAVIFAVHACGQMEVLICWLNHMVDGRSDMRGDIDARIANIVTQHVRVLNFLELTEKSLRQISLVEVLGSTINLCLLGYFILVEWDSENVTTAVTYFIFLVSLTFNIFIFCYIGELVCEQCKKIGEASYMIDWYRITGKRKLCFLLIIAMSKSSINLTAGNIIVLSLTSFSEVVKTSLAYWNMLRKLT